MTYTSLLAKMLVSVSLATAVIAVPQPVNNTEVIVVGATRDIPTSTPPVAVVRKTVSQKPKGDCEKYRPIVEQYDWDVETVMQICKDESQGNPENINWSDKHKDSKGNVICISSQGLMQVGCFWPAELGYTMEDLLIPEPNMAMAYEIYKRSKGFTPWTTYKR